MSKRTVKSILVTVVAFSALVVAVAIIFTDGGAPSRPTHAGGAGAEPAATLRTVLVSRFRMPEPSQPGSALRALRVSGALPRRASVGTVLSDRDCSPDRQGISHCLNRIRLAGGESLSVRHPHRMMDVPCLSPGEQVMVQAA